MGAEGAIKAGSAYIDISARTDKLDRDLRTVGSKMRAFGVRVRDIGLKIGLMGAPLAAFGVMAVKSAMNYEEALSKFQVVFKEQADAAMRFVETTSKALGRSKVDLIGYMATLQDTFVPLGFARDDAREFAQQLTALTIDLGSFNNVADPIVLRDLQSAIVGNHETMRKYGVIITQASLDQELLNMGFAGGAAKASEQAKVLARLNVIMAGTSDAQGDAARTAGSVANQVKALTSTIKDLTVEIGQKFLPALGRTASGITAWSRQNPELAKGIGIVTVGVGALTTAVSALSIATWALSAHPVVAMVSGLLMIAGVLVVMNARTLKAVDQVRDLGSAFEDATGKAIKYQETLAGINIGDPFEFGKFKTELASGWDRAKTFVGAMGGAFGGAFTATSVREVDAAIDLAYEQMAGAERRVGARQAKYLESTRLARLWSAPIIRDEPKPGAPKPKPQSTAIGSLLTRLLGRALPEPAAAPGMPAPFLNALVGGVTAFQGLTMDMPRITTGAIMGQAAELGRLAGTTTRFAGGRGDPMLGEAKTSNTWLEKIYGQLETGLGLQ